MSEAEIDVLPNAGLATRPVRRIVTERAEAQAAGVDLGSQVPHIQADGDALLTDALLTDALLNDALLNDVLLALHDDLARELAGLHAALERLGLLEGHAGPVLELLLDEIRQLADLARHDPHRGQEDRA